VVRSRSDVILCLAESSHRMVECWLLAALLRDPRTGSTLVPPDVVVAQRPSGERGRPQPVRLSVGELLHENETAVEGPAGLVP